MLAFVYLVIMVMLGDSLCRRVYSFVSLPHRFAAAFLSGLLISTWITYLSAFLFARSSQPLLWGNLLFFLLAIIIIWASRRVGAPQTLSSEKTLKTQLAETDKWDLTIIGVFFVFTCWMMFSSLSMSAGNINIATHQWSDFGPNLAIIQSFALGHNFPTEYTHFSGERILYHFLFYFQAGNLGYLGLNLAWSNNLLSILSLISMLILIMTLGDVLFRSRAVGRLGAALFFFHGTLSYIPFLSSQKSIKGALNTILTLPDYLPSGFPYRGDSWGIWSQVVFLNQRHLASSIGFFLLVLIFLVVLYRSALSSAKARNLAPVQPGRDDFKESAENVSVEIQQQENARSEETVQLGDVSKFAQSEIELEDANKTKEVSEQANEFEQSLEDRLETDSEPEEEIFEPQNIEPGAPKETFKTTVAGFVFSGILLGLLPMWNSAIFVAAFPVLALLFFLFPLRKQMLVMAVTTALIALPQIIYLKTGNVRATGYSLLYWGYTIDNPTVAKVIEYLGFTFGFKWLLIFLALFLATWFERRIMLALSGLVAITFLFRFSDELLVNHKFLNVWLVVANLFVAFGLWRLWQMVVLRSTLPGKIAVVVLTLLITLAGIIDLFPIYNGSKAVVSFEGDRLVRWLGEETDPKAIFLSDKYAAHRILLAGRRIYYGWPYFAWSAGYQTAQRDITYRLLFQERDPQKLLQMLQENNISYVAIDDGLRQGQFVSNINEGVYEKYFDLVFEDEENQYGRLVIFKVPVGAQTLSPRQQTSADADELDASVMNTPALNVFEGGRGNGRGQFTSPRGIAIDLTGHLYVADTENERLQKFAPNGDFLGFFGKVETRGNKLRAPNGIAIDSAGNVYVTDASNFRLIKFKADGTFENQWSGPPPGFYGPRDLAISSNGNIYLIDQGRARIVKLNSGGNLIAEWGRQGNGEGEFGDATGITVTDERVYVAEALNARIQVFDLNGKFLTQLIVPEWQQGGWKAPDIVFDSQTKRLYATSTNTNEVLVFDAEGKRLESLKPNAPNMLDNPSAIVLSNANGIKRLLVLNTNGARVSIIELGKAENSKGK